MNSVPIVKVNDVSKRYVIRKDNSVKERLLNFNRAAKFKEDFFALRHVDLQIDAGTTIGLIGPNGSGKSTLLKAIGGIIQPTTGSVQRRGQMAALLELGAGFHPDLTGRENVYLNASVMGLSRVQTASHFEEILEFSGIGEFIDTQVKFYSSGMYVRLAFAVAVHVDPDLLLIDEVLAVGDEAFQKKCLDKIRTFQEEGRTIVLVSHTLSQITSMCSRAIVLARGSVVFDGDPFDAVSVLRSGFATSVELDSRKDDRLKAALANVELGRITEVRVVGASGAKQASFNSGDDISIEVELDAPKSLSTWSVGLHIDNPLGQLVTGATSTSLDAHLGELKGRAVARFSLPRASFGSGEYGVTVALMGSHGQEIARVANATSFTVNDHGGTWGPVRTNMTFEAKVGV
ncbi:ABC transporter ATP-binding protein [Cryobacterium zhongshanensis]|uniref:ABC transporter ATP-binding protein n=1 Tax=Cryobacterium zhongshanensis TaxID=2928153 RepID=A0AA41QVB1_9MICO|nr:ABC transporter ATP-binding protein [Cryobacterium zhongshanensis]MCI4658397.1 ABC transporter ATP-binding protein [Cryobacterium zhongshanensis]